jgi:hypothetical protein
MRTPAVAARIEQEVMVRKAATHDVDIDLLVDHAVTDSRDFHFAMPVILTSPLVGMPLAPAYYYDLSDSPVCFQAPP